jgi:hypothetical protein
MHFRFFYEGKLNVATAGALWLEAQADLTEETAGWYRTCA